MEIVRILILFHCIRYLSLRSLPLFISIPFCSIFFLILCSSNIGPPLFYQPGKAGYYSPRVGPDTPIRLNAYRNVGRIMGLCLLHMEIIPLPLCRHVYKFMINRMVRGCSVASSTDVQPHCSFISGLCLIPYLFSCLFVVIPYSVEGVVLASCVFEFVYIKQQKENEIVKNYVCIHLCACVCVVLYVFNYIIDTGVNPFISTLILGLTHSLIH